MLRSAFTIATAQAFLDGKRQEAEAVLKIAESKRVNPNVGEGIIRLQVALGNALEQLGDYSPAIFARRSEERVRFHCGVNIAC